LARRQSCEIEPVLQVRRGAEGPVDMVKPAIDNSRSRELYIRQSRARTIACGG
jgi:hypothetical protein